MNTFRLHHLLTILKAPSRESMPLDLFLRNYFRANKSAGSKDRKFICETLYGIIRWLGLIDSQCPKPITWESRIQCYNQFPLLNTEHLPPHIQISFPKFLYNQLKAAYGDKKTHEICLASNTQAPTTIRINTLKTPLEPIFNKWKALYDIERCHVSSIAINFKKKINFFALDEFKEGLFEIQDEGSQLIAQHVKASSGDHVLDYCAGAGGKALAIAPKMNNKGQLYLYDIRKTALDQAKKRLKRAGVQNAQILNSHSIKRKQLLKKMDWILLDVPCSGTGTLRRNPDMKWKISQSMIKNLIQTQQQIFEESLKFLHPQGKIVYATCSILPEENEDQINFFLSKYSMQLEAPMFQSFQKNNKMDGFFCAVLSKINPN